MAPYPLCEQMTAFVEKTVSFNSTDSSLAGLRQAYSEMCRAFTPPRPAGLYVVDFELSGVPVRSYQPPVSPPTGGAPCIVYLHGGGWVVGGLDSHDFICAELASTLGVLVIAVDYRLAPEHPFPAALDDAMTAWRFLRAKGYAPSQIAIGGDSAGGNLTAVLVNALREQNERPACVWLVSPWTDLTMSGHSLVTKDAVDPIIHKGYLEELAKAFVPSGIARNDPRISPLFADLRGFPPTLVQVGSHETLLDDATRFAAALGAADVDVTLEIWPEMIHAWPLWNAHLEPGRRALDHAGAFIRRYM